MNNESKKVMALIFIIIVLTGVLWETKGDSRYIIIESILILIVMCLYILKLYNEKKMLKNSNDKLLEQNNKFIQTIDGIGDTLVYCDKANGNFDISYNVRELLDIDENDNLNMTCCEDWFKYVIEDDRVKLEKYFYKFCNDKEGTLFEDNHRITTNKGEIKWIRLKVNARRDEFGKVTSISGSLYDITEKKMNEDKILYMSYFDGITGLYNRNYFKKHAKKFIKKNKGKKAALIFIDIDNFKYVNDSYGHDYGDELLKKIATSFEKMINKDKDMLCRFGGDEFVIFIKDFDDISEIHAVAKNLINIFNRPIKIKEKSIYSSASIGVTLFPTDADNYDMLLKQADAAMYKAKGNGKSRYQFFNDEISEELARNYSLEKGLRDALEDDELYVQFQPKVVLEDGKISGFEALIRWNSKELGFVSPSEFIPVAENTRLIVPIGRFVIEEVLKKCKELIEIGYSDFKIALNLSEIQLRDGNIVEDFRILLDKYEVDPSFIEVEITESILMKSFDENIKTLLKVKELGMSVALDDFGTGYSSLNYLTKLPIDVLKIDRSFVTEIGDNAKGKCIVENIIQLSHKLGIQVVAEGVEIREQVDYLKDMLCDFVQGYYYSKPQNFDIILNLMEKGYIEG
ncbi:PAS domain S-box-containing protein/diguanylate cyclase (GGDEF) domain-containing protein [Clostridium cavendishii DSM 21758]|uniref:PAS domain S-box-containing protein/diguanylate cyclase (GGDEF) domain-containing protein n=1 Tax=Clostridium cavendishii DSM 21758 TaxID=1121302 RepID=A0A1M6CX43_9CLOT|nr:EAL domain-containing protein [Clostridium cavendishii]SHI65318.1 PAS domain S-box-containing protein/diguanylate cyclase (GGDEF) domain-containing protein [Clostridium cavendishii DSM 21758]